MLGCVACGRQRRSLYIAFSTQTIETDCAASGDHCRHNLVDNLTQRHIFNSSSALRLYLVLTHVSYTAVLRRYSRDSLSPLVSANCIYLSSNDRRFPSWSYCIYISALSRPDVRNDECHGTGCSVRQTVTSPHGWDLLHLAVQVL